MKAKFTKISSKLAGRSVGGEISQGNIVSANKLAKFGEKKKELFAKSVWFKPTFLSDR